MSVLPRPAGFEGGGLGAWPGQGRGGALLRYAGWGGGTWGLVLAFRAGLRQSGVREVVVVRCRQVMARGPGGVHGAGASFGMVLV